MLLTLANDSPFYRFSPSGLLILRVDEELESAILRFFILIILQTIDLHSRGDFKPAMARC